MEIRSFLQNVIWRCAGSFKIGINFEPNEIEDQISKNNFGFMFAPNYHSAMKHVGPTRKIGKELYLT